MADRFHKFIGLCVVVLCIFVCVYMLFALFFQSSKKDGISFDVFEGESVAALSTRLFEEGVILHPQFFRRYVAFKDIDRKIHTGTFFVEGKVTIQGVANALATVATREERSITIIPGWNVRDVAAYIEKEDIGTKKQVYALLGEPLSRNVFAAGTPSLGNTLTLISHKPGDLGFEGYLAPDTYRVFSDATLEDIFEKLLIHRDAQFTDTMYADIKQSGRTVHEVMVLASILEREVRTDVDRAIVADLFWRRYDLGWALQADSTVHYVVGTNGSVFTTPKDRDTASLWNTYEYPGFPPCPISFPSLSSIQAAIYPQSNEYWYFLTTLDTGDVKYAKTLEGHNRNVATYLR